MCTDAYLFVFVFCTMGRAVISPPDLLSASLGCHSTLSSFARGRLPFWIMNTWGNLRERFDSLSAMLFCSASLNLKGIMGLSY